ncbi:MAG: DNA polymerase III subunit epsilon [Pseudomonadota bacterium]
MSRQVVLDTETTGLSPKDGHRIVEIGCLETINRIPTGKTFHVYINPKRDMPQGAYDVHGLSIDFLEKHPPFEDIVSDFLSFVQDTPLVIHNVPFDMKFINHELQILGHPTIPANRTICTLKMARKKFPGSPASLDALCKRFKVDNTGRQKHGALIDAELLAKVYIELTGGRQTSMDFGAAANQSTAQQAPTPQNRTLRASRNFRPKQEELTKHRQLLSGLKNPIWNKFTN